MKKDNLTFSEAMQERKLLPFNRQKALAGEPVVTRDGRRATNFREAFGMLYVTVEGEATELCFYSDGKFSNRWFYHLDLFMLDLS